MKTRSYEKTFSAAELLTFERLAVGRQADGSLTVPETWQGYALFGPRIALEDGAYEVRPLIRYNGPSDLAIGYVDVFDGGRILAQEPLTTYTRFSVFLSGVRSLELRVFSFGANFTIEGIEVRAIAATGLVEPPDVPACVPDQYTRLSVGEIWSALNQPGESLVALRAGPIPGDEAIEKWLQAGVEPAEHEIWKAPLDETRPGPLGLSPKALNVIRLDSVASEAAKARTAEMPELIGKLSEYERSIEHTFSFAWLTNLSERQRAFQVTALAGGALLCPCPSTGKILRSDQCFPIRFGKQVALFYRFLGREIFYLVVSGFVGSTSVLYFPARNAAFHLQSPSRDWGKFSTVLRSFKKTMLRDVLGVSEYILSEQKQVAILSNSIDNLGHAIWNDAAGTFNARRLELLDGLPVVSYTHALFDITKILQADGHEILRARDEAELFELVLARKLILVRPTALVVRAEDAALAYEFAAIECSAEVKRRIETARRADCLLWVNLRSHNKVWTNQVDGIEAICRHLVERFAAPAVFLDGTLDCAQVAAEIKNRVPGVTFYDGFDVSLSESVLWAFAVDYYVATIGSGLTLVTWLAAKKGIAHSEQGHLNQMEFWPEVRPDAPAPLHPGRSEIHDLGKGMYCDYQIDPSVIVGLLEKLTS